MLQLEIRKRRAARRRRKRDKASSSEERLLTIWGSLPVYRCPSNILGEVRLLPDGYEGMNERTKSRCLVSFITDHSRFLSLPWISLLISFWKANNTQLHDIRDSESLLNNRACLAAPTPLKSSGLRAAPPECAFASGHLSLSAYGKY